MRKLNAAVVAGLLVAGRAMAGSLDPTNAPGPTMHTLEEIYQKVNAFVSPQTLSATTTVVRAGYYAATNLTQVDKDLAAGNIKTNVTIFGIVGTHAGGGIVYTNATAAVPKTGQKTSYRAGDDGYYTNGVAWPNPRFTVQANTNVVKDNLTGLMWARNANLDGRKLWNTAIDYCTNLTYGGYSDWRLPNRRELFSLIDDGWYNPALCNTAGTGQWAENDPFTGVQSADYWSSTAPTGYTDAWAVYLSNGGVYYNDMAFTYYVWPVRGGQ